MRELTRAEEQIMIILWDLKKGFIRDILERFPEPKPAYNTVSTITRILQDKGFVSHNAYGRAHEYYPLITKDEYSERSVNNLVTNYFSNSFHEMVSFFAREKNLSVAEMEEIMEIMSKEIAKRGVKKRK